MKRIHIIIGLSVLAVGALFFMLTGSKNTKVYTVKKTDFKAEIVCKGEIHGSKATMITIPSELLYRRLYIWQYKIEDLVPEGTLLKKGDFVARLASNELGQRMQNNMQELGKVQADFNNAKLDSAIQLTKRREEIQNFNYDLEYKKIELEQSKYESPAFQRKTKIAYNKLLRRFDKMKRDYLRKQIQLKIRTGRLEMRLKECQEMQQRIQAAQRACTVKATENGMAIYPRLWGERKLKVGDEVQRWNPNIMSLPDLSELNSEIFIKEIDIAKISKGDSVSIKVDALPDEEYRGVVYSIANIGQQQASSGEKVFKVLVRLNQADDALKPNMSTMNHILFDKAEEAITVPREAIFKKESKHYVFLKDKGEIFKHHVEVGAENDTDVLVKEGIKEGDKVLLYQPENHAEISFVNKSKS
ncbi:HlyD family efflux transporter periplasmic adaptor subunit [Prolixibacteraceae bacterium JC049]|nr:HlyD family efflux transporter periplasmic adaptor subunit [Prolixibacteraceae bacterium JC049]